MRIGKQSRKGGIDRFQRLEGGERKCQTLGKKEKSRKRDSTVGGGNRGRKKKYSEKAKWWAWRVERGKKKSLGDWSARKKRRRARKIWKKKEMKGA